jgi:chromosome partitioning protein
LPRKNKRKTVVTTIANQKGGCGKTTTVVSLAAALASRGKTVSIVDCDPQTNATQAFGLDPTDLPAERFTVLDAYLGGRPMAEIEEPLEPLDGEDRLGGNLWLAAGSRGVSGVQFRLEAIVNEQLALQEITHLDADGLRDEHRLQLKAAVDSLRGKRDFVFIDTGPDLGFALTTALIAADYYLIPMVPSAFDISGLKMLLKAASQIRERYEIDLSLLGVLLCQVKGTKLDREIRELLVETFGDAVFKTEIQNSVKFREATFHGLSILEHAEEGEGAAASYLALADEILSRFSDGAKKAGKKTRSKKRTKSQARAR